LSQPKIPSDRRGLENFIADLDKQRADLEARAEALRSEYTRQIKAGNADAALAAKRETESIPIKTEILTVKIESAKSRLSVLLANEPAAQKIRGQIIENWKQIKVHSDAIDAAGETVRRDFAAIKNLEKDLYSLLGEYCRLIGVPMDGLPLTFCEKLPEFLGRYPQKKLSELILEYPWREWQPRTQPPQE